MGAFLSSEGRFAHREIDYFGDAASNAWFGNANKYHARECLGGVRRPAVRNVVTSCHVCRPSQPLALGVLSGDEVIIPDSTWIASAAPTSYVSATPVFYTATRRRGASVWIPSRRRSHSG
jgi:perosamine synthetase